MHHATRLGRCCMPAAAPLSSIHTPRQDIRASSQIQGLTHQHNPSSIYWRPLSSNKKARAAPIGGSYFSSSSSSATPIGLQHPLTQTVGSIIISSRCSSRSTMQVKHPGKISSKICSACSDVATSGSAQTTTTTTSSSSSSSSSTKPPEMCVIVDENNNVVGAATRKETVSKRLLGRGSYVLLFNSAGQLFVSQRSTAKDCYPGCLDITISGVVNQGEEYVDTAARELHEEVGIPAEYAESHLQQLFIFPYKDDICHVFGCAFKLQWDGDVTFSDAEVEWGRFMALNDLQLQLQQQPDKFTPVGRHILQLYLEHAAQQQQQQQQQ